MPGIAATNRVRRLARAGWSADSIALREGIDADAVARILDRPIRGILAHRVRLRHGCGWTVEAIAEGLRIDVDAVRAFLFPPPPPLPNPLPKYTLAERLARRERHCRMRDEAILNRPRSRREMDALSDWRRFRRRDEPGPPAAPELLELPDVEPLDQVEGSAQICDSIPEPQGDWGPMQAAPRPGGASGNAALTDGQAERIRQRRADGVSRADLAREYGVSVATITRITRAETYCTVAAPELPGVEVLDLVEVIPATSPVQEQGERWEETGDRRRRG
jgi:hypothetical protein